jgi:threonyl-tRNA synthetase
MSSLLPVRTPSGHGSAERSQARDVRTALDASVPVIPFLFVPFDAIQLHKTKHLLTHVLTAAVRRRWPVVGTGESGETREGFYVDLLVGDEVDLDPQLAAIEAEMRRVLAEAKRFAAFELSPAAAHELFAGNPIKQAWIEAIAESDRPARLFDLDGVVDMCDCAMKDPRELRAIDPAGFTLAGAIRLPWREHARTLWITRVSGTVAGGLDCACPLCVD